MCTVGMLAMIKPITRLILPNGLGPGLDLLYPIVRSRAGTPRRSDRLRKNLTIRSALEPRAYFRRGLSNDIDNIQDHL
jgi:hypothetical protein